MGEFPESEAIMAYSRRAFLLAVGAALMVPADAFAYLDPGSGSLLLQAVAAGCFSLAVFFRPIKRWIVRCFTHKD